MAKSLFTKEIKDYILSEIARHDLVSVDDIAKIIYDLHIYNAETAEFQWCRDKARRLMASWKDKDGIRHFKREIFERRQAEVKAVIDSRGVPLRAKTLDYCTNASICATICKRKYERAAGPQE